MAIRSGIFPCSGGGGQTRRVMAVVAVEEEEEEEEAAGPAKPWKEGSDEVTQDP